MPATESFKRFRFTDKHKAIQKRYSQSEKGKKCKRISKWKSRGIICDYDAIYEIYLNTNNCDSCNKEIQTGFNKALDHCHSCGTVRGIICPMCNRYDKLKCYVCDSP